MLNTHINHKTFLVVLIMAIFCFFSISAYAFPIAADDNQTGTTTEKIADPYNRQSPFGSVEGLLTAIQKQDINLLSLYLDPSFTKTGLTNDAEKQLFLHNITNLINQNTKMINYTEVSRLETGKLDDTLPEDIEKIGELNIKGTPDVLLKRIDNKGQPIWVLSSLFLKKASSYSHNTQPNIIDEKTPKVLQRKFFGYSLGHFFASILILVLAMIIGAIMAIVLQTACRVAFHHYKKIFFSLEVTVLPLTIIFATLIYGSLLDYFSVDWLTHELTLPIVNIFKILTGAWLIYRIIEIISENVNQKVLDNPKNISKSMVFLLTGLAKLGLIFLTVLFLFNNFKVDIPSWFALIGLGGLAFALGSQKVIENLIGSLVVVADKPIDIGDFCRFGTIIGTVESIGIRSTRIRTLERSLVTIPNGIFSSAEIENYSKRDKFLFYHLFAFALTSKKIDIEILLVSIRELLDNSEQITTSENRVRLRYTDRDCIKIEVRSYITAIDPECFLEYQEILLLDLMSIIEDSEIEYVKSSIVLTSVDKQ